MDGYSNFLEFLAAAVEVPVVFFLKKRQQKQTWQGLESIHYMIKPVDKDMLIYYALVQCREYV